MSLDLLLQNTARLRAAVAGWSVGRWTAAPRPLPDLLSTSTTCAGVARHLVQVLADLGADAEGRPRQAVPALESDLGLADQIAVMAYDIALAEPPGELVESALAEVLLHRAEIDGTRVSREVLDRAAAACPVRRPH
ncbi:MAG: hypothetical protein M3O55_09870 [Actinomycetota bacterium]|nr:hypothetical protein [Actinomycetota bacterium]